MVTPGARQEESSGVSFRKRLEETARHIGQPLSGAQARSLTTHYRLLLRWGRRMNLTGLRDEEAVIRRHFLEPLAAADLLGNEGSLLDLGSGNGFPALPLNVLRPGLRLLLVESSEKKSEFLWAVIRELGLHRARVITRRIRRRADLSDLLPVTHVTFRAIRGRDLLGGDPGSLLQPGGSVLAFVSRNESQALRSDPPPGLRWSSCRELPSTPEAVVVVLEPAG